MVQHFLHQQYYYFSKPRISNSGPEILVDFGGFPKLGVPFWRVLIARTVVILGFILRSPYLGKLPCVALAANRGKKKDIVCVRLTMQEFY